MVRPFSDAEIAPYLLFWIEYLSGLKAWKRVGAVIELFLQKVKGYLEWLGGYHSCSTFVRNALRAVAPYCAESDRVDLYERAALAMLPYSFWRL